MRVAPLQKQDLFDSLNLRLAEHFFGLLVTFPAQGIPLGLPCFIGLKGLRIFFGHYFKFTGLFYAVTILRMNRLLFLS